MPRGKRSQENKDLEDQLRSMILGNVRISSDDDRSQQPTHGRGRGRGSGHQYVPPHLRHAGNQQPTGVPGPSQASPTHVTNGQFPTQQDDQTSQHGFRNRRQQSMGHVQAFNGRGQPYQNASPRRHDSIDAMPSHGRGGSTHHPQHQLLSRPHHSQPLSPQGMLPSGPRSQIPPKVPPMAAFIAQCELLDTTAAEEISKVEMSQTEFSEKDAFRARLETICREEISKVFPDLTATLSLRAYGSIISGFATQGSDVDLTIVWSGATREDPEFKAQLPRVVEHAILKAQHGARLLSRTRVPIIKVCQVPGEELYAALMEERQKWEELSEEEKYPSLAPQPDSPTEEDEGDPSAMQNDIEAADKHEQPVEIDPDVSRSGKKMETTKRITMNDDPLGFLMQLKSKKRTEEDDLIRYCTQYINARRFALQASEIDDQTYAEYFLEGLPTTVAESTIQTCTANLQTNATNSAATTFERYYEVAHSIIGRLNAAKAKKGKPWLRERALGRLDFPKIGVGIQCDINFSNPLAMHNTELLRLYSLCDPRVQPMVLFIKAWTKRRKINSAYNGTLSSYGYVLLVLHFLINIAQPPVLPNLQHVFGTGDREVLFNGYNISFYRDEAAIRQMATTHQWTQNNEPLGVLLRNFFHYYAAQGTYVIGTGFNWMRDVISIRTPRGIMTKEWKGWTGAKTITVENREIRQRYLLAIEDPFEVDHNVGRPVTHNGIVTIRDEFRRVWRILMAVGRGVNAEGGLFDVVVENGTGQTDAAESVVNTHAIASDGILQQETALKSAKA